MVVESEFSVQIPTKKFSIDNHHKTIYESVGSECSDSKLVFVFTSLNVAVSLLLLIL